MWEIYAVEEYLEWFSQLTGGDKKGKDKKNFYKDLIGKAERLMEKYKDHEWGK
jgi:hypothetical protein